MDIVAVLRKEEAKLRTQLTAIQKVIATFNADSKTVGMPSHGRGANGHGKRTLSAVVRAKISRAAKARWAKIRASKPTRRSS